MRLKSPRAFAINLTALIGSLALAFTFCLLSIWVDGEVARKLSQTAALFGVAGIFSLPGLMFTTWTE